ncbi:MAG TPA: hypothetical protein G4O02_17000 [Caldilineae bacterium]|nr:hypothetical protein [Caldilineae bacterium]
MYTAGPSLETEELAARHGIQLRWERYIPDDPWPGWQLVRKARAGANRRFDSPACLMGEWAGVPTP